MFGFPSGSYYRKPVVFYDEQGTAIDLTGATGLAVTVYPEPREGQSASLTMTVANSKLSVASGTGGTATLIFDNDDLTAGEYTYVATGTLASGDIVTLGRAWFRVT